MDATGRKLSRRQVLSAAGLAAVAVPLGARRPAAALVRRADVAGAPGPEQVHVQFGADAASQVAVSWAAPAAVSRPRLRLGLASSGFGRTVPAEERTYSEALTGEVVWTYHARLAGLHPDTQYVYQVLNDGAAPVAGTFRTGPRGRSRGFRFTSFGDQAIPAAVGQGLGPWTPNAGYIVSAVESLNPLFHLFNGDLCYANVSDAPVATWASFFGNNTRSAGHRAWMPSAGNHENEVGNGPQGMASYQTRFELPDNGSREFRGNWYAFTVGPVRVISLNNDDVCLQDGGFSGFRRDHVPTYVANGDNPYINGYSSGEQRRWLERELAAASRSEEIDWVVVCMHQVAMSSAHFNGADLGIRQNWLPLFDKYGVDLVVAGHEHHFERTFPVRGTLSGSTLLTPAPQGTDPYLMDTSAGTVHMIIGGGGHSSPTPVSDFDMPHDGVLITSVGPGSPRSPHAPVYATEPAPWSAYRDLQTPYGFASFDVVPHEAGGTTSITVTHYGADKGSPDYTQRDQFVMRKRLGRDRVPLAGAVAARLSPGFTVFRGRCVPLVRSRRGLLGKVTGMECYAHAGLRFEVTDMPPADGGGSGQVAVLLHGFPQDRHCWAGPAAALAAAGYRVLAPDQRGYSAEARPAARSAYTLARLAGDVLALADAAGAQRFHLVGHDWGAALAWYVAGHHPGRLMSLACLSVPHPQAFSRALTSSSQAARSWYMAAFQLPWLPERALSRRGGQAMRAALIRTGLDPDSAARYAARAADPAAMRGPVNWYRAIPLGLRERTGRIVVPTLFIWSEGDPFVSWAAARRCGDFVTGPYHLEVLNGTSHWLPEQAPDQVAALLAAHFARARGG